MKLKYILLLLFLMLYIEGTLSRFKTTEYLTWYMTTTDFHNNEIFQRVDEKAAVPIAGEYRSDYNQIKNIILTTDNNFSYIDSKMQEYFLLTQETMSILKPTKINKLFKALKGEFSVIWIELGEVKDQKRNSIPFNTIKNIMYNANEDKFEIITIEGINYVTKLSPLIKDNIIRRILFRLICLKYEVLWMMYQKGARHARDKGLSDLSQDEILSQRDIGPIDPPHDAILSQGDKGPIDRPQDKILPQRYIGQIDPPQDEILSPGDKGPIDPPQDEILSPGDKDVGNLSQDITLSPDKYVSNLSQDAITLPHDKNVSNLYQDVIYVSNLSQDVILSRHNENDDIIPVGTTSEDSSKDKIPSAISEDGLLKYKKEILKRVIDTEHNINNLRRYTFFADKLQVLNNYFNYYIRGYEVSYLSHLREVVDFLKDNGLYCGIGDDVVLKSFLNIFGLIKPANVKAFYNALIYQDSVALSLAVNFSKEHIMKFFKLPLSFYAILRKSNYELIENLIIKPNYLQFKAIQHLVSLDGKPLKELVNLLQKYDLKTINSIKEFTKTKESDIFRLYEYSEITSLIDMIKNGNDMQSKEEMNDIAKLEQLILGKGKSPGQHADYFECFFSAKENNSQLELLEMADAKDCGLLDRPLTEFDNNKSNISDLGGLIVSSEELSEPDKVKIERLTESLIIFNKELSQYEEKDLKALKNCSKKNVLKIASTLILQFRNKFNEIINQIQLFIKNIPLTILQEFFVSSQYIAKALGKTIVVLNQFILNETVDDEGMYQVSIKKDSSLEFSNQKKELYKPIIMNKELIKLSQNEFNALKKNLNIPAETLQRLIELNTESEIEVRRSRINNYFIHWKRT
jgi:hypothetical protein